MKLRPKPNSTQPRIFEGSEYVHPWYEKTYNKFIEFYGENNLELIKPNPPSKEAIKRAQFKDKTYYWQRDNSVRPRNQRSSK